MPRPTDSGRVDLNEVFLHMQRRMLSHLEVGSALEHASTCGAASEAHWLKPLQQPSAGALPRLQRLHCRFRRPPQPPDRHCHLRPLLLAPDLPLRIRLLSPCRERLRHCGGEAGPDPPVRARRRVKIGSVRRLSRTSVQVPFAGGAYPPKRPTASSACVAATRSVWVKDFEPNLTSALGPARPGRIRGSGLRRHPGRLRAASKRLSLSHAERVPHLLHDPPHRAPPRPRQRPRRRPHVLRPLPQILPQIAAFNTGPGV